MTEPKPAVGHVITGSGFSSANYWERRYADGGTSGSGSYGRLAEFKATFLNAWHRSGLFSSLGRAHTAICELKAHFDSLRSEEKKILRRRRRRLAVELEQPPTAHVEAVAVPEIDNVGAQPLDSPRESGTQWLNLD
jgi:hypothetical protein